MKPNPESAAPSEDPPVAYLCTVLETPTTIGDVICGAGAKLYVRKEQAEALAAMTPPRVRIEGV